MKVAANLATMFTDIPLIQRYEKVAKIGFKLVEVPFPYSIPAKDLKKAADENNLQHVLINAPVGCKKEDKGLGAIPERKDEFKESLNKALEYAQVLNCKIIHIMSGYYQEGNEFANKTFIDNLKYANTIFEKEDIKIVIEPINGYSMPGYFLNNIYQAINIIDNVNSNNVKLLFDIFHIQQIHGQISGLIKKFNHKIGHIQIAQVPHRDEPDSLGELNYEYVFNLLKNFEYGSWVIGCEYINTKSNVDWVNKYSLKF